ncbi:MAG: heterodisulfide reductase-related iron-sulfur binding cluster [Deltaproteobacteria bacterium]|nr:heterodisulfide reductase-related iron-sulfur binding cluster [Deltaproteobacteria bacterium]
MTIKPTPTSPPCFDPDEPRFWDAKDLEDELRRAFEICHGCRMCVSYCPSFPALFDRIDANHEERGLAHDASTLNEHDMRLVTDLCWQCKICYVKCPYTPDDNHEWQLDFPKVLWREKVVRSRREGISVQERLLGEPGVLGVINSGPLAPLVNFVAKSALVRKVGERAAGISARFPLPEYAVEPFDRWFAKHRPAQDVGRNGTVVLFSTCLVDYNRPGIGQAAVAVLEHAGIKVVRPKQVCCGMPNMDTGDLDGVREKARYNVEQLAPLLDDDVYIVAPGPSCSMTLRKEYPELIKTPESALVGARTMDLMEYLWKIAWREKKALPKNFENPLGKVAYHAPCHMRAQKIATPARLLLEKIPNTEVRVIEQCSAVDGTWGMKAEYYDLGVKYSQRLVRQIADTEAEHVASDCPLASQRIAKENGVRVQHPVELLAHAYGLAPNSASAASKVPTP